VELLTAAFAGMQHAMHAMAQPLTLLHSRLYLASSAAFDREQVQKLIADTTGDVDHLSMVFRLMQQLVHTHCAEALIKDIPCSSWTGRLPLDAEAVFAGGQLTFNIEIPADLPMVRIDPTRTRQAILDMLSIAGQLSRHHDRIRCVADVRESAVAFRVEAFGADERQHHEMYLDDITQLRLALADACSVSQGGSFKYTLRPLVLTLELPLAHPATAINPK
jgi:signal transduction histidine kinase